eukprot:6193669-Pleurochrysis_carterae.AAC.1
MVAQSFKRVEALAEARERGALVHANGGLGGIRADLTKGPSGSTFCMFRLYVLQSYALRSITSVSTFPMYAQQALRLVEWALRSALMADGLHVPSDHYGLYVSKCERRIC